MMGSLYLNSAHLMYCQVIAVQLELSESDLQTSYSPIYLLMSTVVIDKHSLY